MTARPGQDSGENLAGVDGELAQWSVPVDPLADEFGLGDGPTPVGQIRVDEQAHLDAVALVEAARVGRRL
jgi:hypothetical protein